MNGREKPGARGAHGESAPPGRKKDGDTQPAQPSSEEQSGSAGRRTDAGEGGRSKDTGQGKYGQTGLGGKKQRETDGQARYRQSGPDGSDTKPRSNPGSGRADNQAEDSPPQEEDRPASR